MISRKERKIQFSEYGKHASEQVLKADAAREQAITRLQKIRAKRQSGQKRQLNRLVEKYGDEHPRVARQAKQLASDAEMEKYLMLSAERARDEVDVIDDGFVLKGRVLDDNAKGLVGHAVQLIDQRNNMVGKPAKTDKAGRFIMVVESAGKPTAQKALLVVLDAKGTQIHKERLPVVVKLNDVETRDIVIAKISRVNRSIEPIVKKAKAKSYAPTKKKVVAKRKTTTNKAAKKVTQRKATISAGKQPTRKIAKKVTKKTAKKAGRKKVQRVAKKVARNKKTSTRKKKR